MLPKKSVLETIDIRIGIFIDSSILMGSIAIVKHYQLPLAMSG